MQTSRAGTSNNDAIRAGFTLVELVVVCIIIGIMFGVALPKLGPALFQSQLQASTRTLAAEMRYLYSAAIIRKTYLTLFIDVNEGRYYVREGAPRNIVSAMEEALLDEEYGMAGSETEAGGVGDFFEIRPDPDLDRPHVETDLMNARKLPDSVKFVGVRFLGSSFEDTGEVEIIFTPRGLVDGGTIHLVNKRKKEMTIAMDMITGEMTPLAGWIEMAIEGSERGGGGVSF